MIQSTNKILNEVQRKIYGQRTEKLTPIELNKLFQFPITPEFNLVIYRALQRSIIDPDITILQALPYAQTKDYLIPIALCIRFGADANMYVNAPKIGIIHILGYVYTVLKQNSTSDQVLNTIILMLIIGGARPSLPIFDFHAGKINPESKRSSSESVLEWLNNQGYNTILNRVDNTSDLNTNVDLESLSILSIYLDNSEIMARSYEERDMLLSIRAFSMKSFDNIPASNIQIGLDYKSLDDTVTYLNSEAYEKLLKRGQIPSYVLINKILSRMNNYKKLGNTVAVQELEKMLLSSIASGTQLDSDQFNIVSTLGIITNVSQEYELPYWRKVCQNPTNKVPESLRKLAISLNLDPNLSQTSICENITALSQADKEELKVAARKRQQLRIASDLGIINEFIGGNTPNLVCRNMSLLPNNPLDYNDMDIAYYRDSQMVVWCFPSNMFDELLDTGVNPYNSTILPESFKEKLRYQINILKQLGINSYKAPVTFSSAIDNLNQKDSMTGQSNDQVLDAFIQLGIQNNIGSETIKNLSKENMANALKSINYDVDFTSLSTRHSLKTTAYIIGNINDPNTVKNFFESLSITRKY